MKRIIAAFMARETAEQAIEHLARTLDIARRHSIVRLRHARIGQEFELRVTLPDNKAPAARDALEDVGALSVG